MQTTHVGSSGLAEICPSIPTKSIIRILNLERLPRDKYVENNNLHRRGESQQSKGH